MFNMPWIIFPSPCLFLVALSRQYWQRYFTITISTPLLSCSCLSKCPRCSNSGIRSGASAGRGDLIWINYARTHFTGTPEGNTSTRNVTSQQYEKKCIFTGNSNAAEKKYTSALIFYYPFKVKPILQSSVKLLFKNSCIITELLQPACLYFCLSLHLAEFGL